MEAFYIEWNRLCVMLYKCYCANNSTRVFMFLISMFMHLLNLFK